MRRLTTAATVFVLAAIGLTGTAGVADAAPVSAGAECPTGWGSTDKSSEGHEYRALKNIRTGSHACYDRIVFDLGSAAPGLGYRVGYVDEFHQDGSGDLIPVKGGAILQVFINAPSYDPNTGQRTYPGRGRQPLPGVDLTGYRTFQDTKFGASFEGQTQVAVGVRARLPFRAEQVGDKLVVDVAHSW
ncbi:AMIN-like domain-containing (lipo)protein [Streptomyces sp. CA-181903]|uniref:AMIN-like domain-containing (lipo)protein n=1 Tax=Streptomyces sp. CA-181903 TaxID=3240055 RepID=UPI003D8D0023